MTVYPYGREQQRSPIRGDTSSVREAALKHQRYLELLEDVYAAGITPGERAEHEAGNCGPNCRLCEIEDE